MFKSLTTTLAALSLVLAGATPVAAQGSRDDDVGKLLFGLLAVTTLGVAINNAQERRNRTTEVHHRAPRVEPPRYRDHDRNLFEAPRVQRRGAVAGRTLPRECLRRVETRYGDMRMFTRRCLTRNYIFHGDLPQQCSVRVFTDRGARRGYDPQCLREFGFRARRN